MGFVRLHTAAEITSLSNKINSGTMPLLELCKLLDHSSVLIRANVIDTISRNFSATDDLVLEFARLAKDPTNQKTIVMGDISLAHMAIGALLRFRDSHAETVASSIIDSYPKDDKESLMDYLKSDNLIKE